VTPAPRDLGASVQARLRNVAKQRADDVQLVLTQFTLERLLHRISVSPHNEQFVLKGAMLFLAWTAVPHRTTRDLDLLGHGPSDAARLIATFRDLCTADVEPDGITFDPDSIVLDKIREDQSYEGWRVTMRAALGTARIDVQVDIGFGDAVHPAPERLRLPTLLDMPAPVVLAYPRETVVAEKFEAMISLGLLNSRMKDFFDLHYLATNFAFDGGQLSQALRGTFSRRLTTWPTELPVALSDTFATDADKGVQWRAFLRRTGLGDGLVLNQAIAFLREFLWPVVAATPGSPPGTWPPGSPWLPAD
jgi:hypothetical protein